PAGGPPWAGPRGPLRPTGPATNTGFASARLSSPERRGRRSKARTGSRLAHSFSQPSGGDDERRGTEVEAESPMAPHSPRTPAEVHLPSRTDRRWLPRPLTHPDQRLLHH